MAKFNALPMLQFGATILFGGAAGAFITYYFQNLQTSVSYSVTTTSLGAGAETKSVLPDLKLILGDKPLPVVYTHTIELKHASGPELDHASVGITLHNAQGVAAAVQLLGNILPYGPDPVHKITCGPFDVTAQAIVCTLGQIGATVNPYRVVIATDQKAEIKLAIQGKNTRIERNEGKSNEGQLVTIALALATWALVLLTAFLQWAIFRRRIRDSV